MSVYSASVSNVTPVVANDLITVQGGAATQIYQIIEISVGAMGTASAANQVNLSLDNALGITTTAITPSKFSPLSVAAVCTASSGWATQPTLLGIPLITLPVNANGGIYRWVARPGEEITGYGTAASPSTGSYSLRPTTVNGPLTVHIVWVEGL